MLINTKGSILESLPLFRGLEFGNKTFHFDCGINLSRCGIGWVVWGILVAPVVSGLILGASIVYRITARTRIIENGSRTSRISPLDYDKRGKQSEEDPSALG